MRNDRFGDIEAPNNTISLGQPGERKLRSGPYISGRRHDILKEEVDRMTNMGVIEPKPKKWEAPRVFYPKKDGALRLFM